MKPARLRPTNTTDCQNKTPSYRLHYDAGTAAYRAKQLEKAEEQFNATLASPEVTPDLTTQERTYYNLGNTKYHMGEPLSEPDKKQELWQQAIDCYTNALRLNTNDVDAKNNLAFVKQKLEELKKQQQQQQQKQNKNQKNQKNDKDQQDQQNQQNQDQKTKRNKSSSSKNPANRTKRMAKTKNPGRTNKKEEEKKRQQKQAKKKDREKQKQEQEAKANSGEKRTNRRKKPQQEAAAAAGK